MKGMFDAALSKLLWPFIILPTVTLLQFCTIGSKALLANEAIDSGPNGAIGELMSEVFVTATNDSVAGCLILELKYEEFIKRINVELIYQDVNDTVQKASLFDYEMSNDRYSGQQRFGMFEFILNNVLKYQVCAPILLPIF